MKEQKVFNVSMKVYEAAVNRLIMKSYYDVEKGAIVEYISEYPGKTIKQFLNGIIGDGCGGSLYKEVDGFWLVKYSPGIKITVVDHDLNNVTLSKKLIFQVTDQILNGKYFKSKQLKLEF